MDNSAHKTHQKPTKKQSLEYNLEANFENNTISTEISTDLENSLLYDSKSFEKTESEFGGINLETQSLEAQGGKIFDKKNAVKSYSYNKQSKKQKQLILAASLFLLGQDGTKKTYWTILTASVRGKVLKLGVTAQKNKYGTTLSLLRKYAKSLSEYLNQSGFLNFYPKIVFFINKEAEEINELYSLLDSIEASAVTES